MDNQIPRRLIQTGRSRELPLRHRTAVTNLRLLHPDFEYLFFDDQAVQHLIDSEFPQFRAIFDAFPFKIQKYDFFRYLAVYHHGGFYFDLDVYLASPLDDLLATGCVFPFEGLTFSRFLRDRLGMDWQIGNYAFGAAAKHPFLKLIIENCVRSQTDTGWVAPMMAGAPSLSRDDFVVFNTTGPGLISRTLAESPGAAAGVEVLFPADVCDTATWNCFGDRGIHLMDGSWRPSTGFIRRRLAQLWEVRKMRRLIEESRALGKTRRSPGVGQVSALP